MTEELRSVLYEAGVEPMSPNGDVWDLRERGFLASIVGVRSTLTPEVRRRVLEVVLASSSPLFLFTSEDLGTAGPGMWRAILPGIWSLKGLRDPAVLLNEEAIQLGNWVLLAADRPPNERIPDLIRATELEVLSFMRENGVRALIDSFHDDVEWRVATTP